MTMEHPYIPLPSPHAHAGASTTRIMFTVWLALLPASLFGVWQFGWPALNLLLITSAAALVTEAACLRLAEKPVLPFLGDGSALLTAWLLAMSLPPWAPWWIGALGGLLAVLLGKQVFGGLGQNPFNPAMLARVALLIAFPLEMTTWAAPPAVTPGFVESLAITFQTVPLPDALTGATLLGHARTELSRGHGLDTALAGAWSMPEAFYGFTLGSLGETSALLILLGGVVLVATRVISLTIPVAVLGSVALLASGFHLFDPLRYAGPGVHLLSGGLLLGAFFIATDPVTSPSTPRGQLLFGAGCGALVYAIRTWGGYPEGVAFAVLLMNAATPLIDHYLRPRIYGRDRNGRPLPKEKP